LSAEEWIRELKATGQTYRHAVMHQDYNIAKGIGEVWGRMRFVPRNKLIGPQLYAPAHVKKPFKYLTTFWYRARNVETGEAKEGFLTIGHDMTLPRGVLEDEFEDRWRQWQEESPPLKVWELVKLEPISGVRSIRP
jgi:hypothetical protein